jgi:hypothetical protein
MHVGAEKEGETLGASTKGDGEEETEQDAAEQETAVYLEESRNDILTE